MTVVDMIEEIVTEIEGEGKCNNIGYFQPVHCTTRRVQTKGLFKDIS